MVFAVNLIPTNNLPRRLSLLSKSTRASELRQEIPS